MKLRESRFDRRVLVLGLCAVVGLVLAGVIVSLTVGGRGKSLPAMPTTGAYRPISVPKPATGFNAHFIQGVDPDSMAKAGTDLGIAFTRAAGANRYDLTVSNTSSIGSVDAFYWSPPKGLTIERVVRSSVGTCTLGGATGIGGKQFPTAVLDPKISCRDVNLKPPTCTCRNDGGQIVITFVADKFPSFVGSVGVTSATPVFKVIPGYVQSPDVPACKPGQSATATQPCV